MQYMGVGGTVSVDWKQAMYYVSLQIFRTEQDRFFDVFIFDVHVQAFSFLSSCNML